VDVHQFALHGPQHRHPLGEDAAGLVLCLPAPLLAFHDGGVASCSGCHAFHGSQDGMPLTDLSEPLLKAPTATDVCLLCHGGPHGVFGNNPLDPPAEKGAGNFVFLLEDNLNDSSSPGAPILGGETAGHSIISLERGVAADPNWAQAPGGNYPSHNLGCTSCHDPHGNDNFRMLHGAGPIQGGIFEFTYDAPQATGMDFSDPLEAEKNDLHTAYQADMTRWCANCHGMYHTGASGSDFRHPPNAMMNGPASRSYNLYNGASDPVGNFPTTAYLAAVPFESPRSTTTSTDGATMGSRVMCLSCHRAHASSAPHSGRWDFNVDLLEQDGVASGSWPIPNPYPGDHAQGPLCAKCHYEETTP
jgi:hypothetical protein